MFVFKKKYFLIIESIKDIDLRNIKKRDKIIIIYRNNKAHDTFSKLHNFRSTCKIKKIKLFIANDMSLCKDLRADGVYISANNSSLKYSRFKNSNVELIGAAHNNKEIRIKKLQGCKDIIFSRLFRTSYKHKKNFLGAVRFNLLNKSYKNRLFPLGGIRLSNLNKIKNVNCSGFVIYSEVKKKPAIIDRLF
mgnify:FL=1|tara:strand:- start:789 stop:1361 length:573 start_codon:yes stop_codon:yes gene_type:complete